MEEWNILLLGGSSGIQGLDEYSGNQGLDEYSGNQGLDEYSGNQGLDEYSGNQGLDEYSGNQGLDEYSGNQGLDEYSGNQGLDEYSGNLWLDEYSGNQGLDEYSGNQGLDENSGNQGLDEYSGNQGLDEYSGNQGLDEYSGNQGLDEYSGNQGLDENSGNLGLDEYSGNQGLDEYSGNQGLDEYSGNQGLDEYSGNQGLDEYSGNQGLDEYSGNQGLDEYSGIQGLDEYSGNQELDEYSGNQGLDEYSGNQGNVFAAMVFSVLCCLVYYDIWFDMTLDSVLGKELMKRNSTTLAQFEKWIVVTSIRPPTDDVKYMANMPGWRVVVVGDVKSPGNWSYPNCDFLSITKQKVLNFKISSHLPFKSYARKNIGYLYAVLNGAKYIYETDDDNRPFDDLEGFIYSHRTSGMMYDGQRVFNPYHHFGQSTLWPRGYPLSEIGAVTSKSYWLDSDWTTPTIQQGVVNGDPDVDAVFRLTRKSVTSPINVTFDPCAPPVFVPQGVFSPFNSQNTLFHHRAFWAMLIPMTTTFRMCDIWRGYWAQRLMWEIGDRLSFFTANAYQNRSAHSFMEDATGEKDMYFQTEALIDFLTNWTCHSSMSFFQCILKLTSDMADKNFWKHEEIDLTRSWLDDLTELGYPEPNRVIEVLTLIDNETLKLENYNTFHDDNFNKTKTKVTFIPSEQKDQSVNVEVNEETPAHEAKDILTTMCPNISKTVWTLKNDQSSHYYHDILLVVVFNWPRHYGNVRYLDAMYSKVFPNIVYCGDDAQKFYEQTKPLGKLLSFLELSLEGGNVGYICTVKAMEMNYKVKGYLIMSDDIMFKHWTFFNASKDHFWITNEGLINPQHPWSCGEKVVMKEDYHKAMCDIYALKDFPEFVINSSSFLTSLSNFTGNPKVIESSMSDLYYVPASKRHDTMWYMMKFYKYKVFLEKTIPTVIRGLERKDKIVLIKGRSLWFKERVNPFRIYFNVNHFFHPMKLENTGDITFQDLCRMYVPDILKYSFGWNCSTV
ncbi:sugar transporter-like protein [Bulinus truncatus]|nr:sugar transporter-like protein [Bulinus truncatus]